MCSLQEFLTFFSATLCERTANGIRQSVEQDQNTGYVFTNIQGLSCVIICDKEYPQRVAFALINRILEEFCNKYSREMWMSSSKELEFEALKLYLEKYQNPQEADAIMRVQRELDETKVILVQSRGPII